MKKDLVSVIVLVYNIESYVKRCIESIIKQTYKNIEIIVIIDGSTDKSSSIVKRLAKKDERIRIIERENRGTGYSRIEGYKEAKGSFIMYVDGDDYIEKDMIETMYRNLKEYNVDLVHCQYKIIKNGKVEIPKNILNRNVRMDLEQFEPQFFDLLYKTEHCNQMWKQLMKRKILKNITKIDRDLVYSEDLLCNLKIYREMKSILFIPDELYIYNQDSTGINLKNDINFINKKIADVIDVYYSLYKSVLKFNIKDKKYYKKMASIKFIYNIILLLNDLAKVSSKTEFKNSIDNILNNKKVKEVFKYIKSISTSMELKRAGYKVSLNFNLLINNKTNQLYYFNKFLKVNTNYSVK